MEEVKQKSERDELGNPAYEIFVGVLSLLSILNLIMAGIIDDEDLSEVLILMNALFSMIFLADFCYRLNKAQHKAEYFFRGFGWADLLASLPFPQAKILRVFRLLRVFRIMRQYGARRLLAMLLKDRASSALVTVLLMGFIVLEFGSLWILYLEQNYPGANITTAGDSLWYVVVTMSTVGYGDQYPVSPKGRLVGSGVIIVGVGIFGTFTGYLANLFLAPKAKAAAAAELPPVQQTVTELRDLVARQQATLDSLEQQLQMGQAS